MAFSPDGKTLLTGSDDRTARLWGLPDPVEGDSERVALWVQVCTAMELDDNGVAHRLDPDAWRERRRRLQDLGQSHLGRVQE